jgi:redox-sensitive bicupin YhaK (pirin superfamily)
MNTILHQANTRGHANHGWLDSWHTFSFANYYDPKRVHFGALRVINDDIIDGGRGFGTHPHEDMEIITIPLSGALAHKDSMGNSSTIEHGEVQIMSAGTGIAHSEFNPNPDQPVNLLQIWVMPGRLGIAPRYEQKKFELGGRKNKFQLVVSPDGKDGSVWINQNAFFSMADLEAGKKLVYKKHDEKNYVYFFVIDGELSVGNEHLQKRDGLGITSGNNISLEAHKDTQLLVMEIPA